MNAMAGYHFHPLPIDADPPEVWRAIDRAVARWIGIHGGSPLLAKVAGWVSLAEGHGDSALPLAGPDAARHGMPALDEAALAALRAEPLVRVIGADDVGARGDAPLVIEHGQVYLRRNFLHEVAVAQHLVARRAAAVPAAPVPAADLDRLFAGVDDASVQAQRAAVAGVPGRRLFVLTGGPGTGKTTTVLRMLLGLSREHQAVTGRLPQLRIATPTGKAAQRLAESLREGAERLQGGAQPLGQAWTAHMDAVLAADAATVHRLLGSRGRHGGHAFHAGETLPADIVVVDEASMLDLGLLRALLAALREDAVLVLVGDADQLTSVGTGSVMMDVVQALEAGGAGDIVRLSHCFRADGALVPINEAVRTGDAAAFDAALGAAEVHAVPDSAALHRRLAAWTRRLQAAMAAAGIATPVASDDAAGLTARLGVLRGQQLLCALREGPFGATQAAEWISSRLRAWDALASWSDGAWYPGRCVMVTRNDHAARLFNGDVGVCVLVENGDGPPFLQVAFERAPDPSTAHGEGGGVRLFDPNTLPPHEDAFALTVHKSQGSEYRHVAVLLPPDPRSPLLVRQMLYTGLSRARTSLELWAMMDVAAKALTTPLSRYGRLAERMA